jgi:hypothetical protein
MAVDSAEVSVIKPAYPLPKNMHVLFILLEFIFKALLIFLTKLAVELFVVWSM